MKIEKSSKFVEAILVAQLAVILYLAYSGVVSCQIEYVGCIVPRFEADYLKVIIFKGHKVPAPSSFCISYKSVGLVTPHIIDYGVVTHF